MAKKNTDKIVFDHIKVLDAGAKGVSVAKVPDGKVIFIPNVVPGDVVDMQTFKKRKPDKKLTARRIWATEMPLVPYSENVGQNSGHQQMSFTGRSIQPNSQRD